MTFLNLAVKELICTYITHIRVHVSILFFDCKQCSMVEYPHNKTWFEVDLPRKERLRSIFIELCSDVLRKHLCQNLGLRFNGNTRAILTVASFLVNMQLT